MIMKRNLLETISIVSCSGSVICIFLNYVTNISPISGIWFLSYLLLLFVLSLLSSFKLIQWFLHLNRPIKYDIESIIEKCPYLSFLRSVLPKIPEKTETVENKEYDTNELSVITTVLEKKLVSSWYVPYISQEIGFPFACKQMLDQMISKTFQIFYLRMTVHYLTNISRNSKEICNKIESKEVFVDVCAVLVSHLKEYKKAKKRHEKSPESSVESHYKKTHPILDDNNKKLESADHCTNLLRIMLKELVPWELWDTPHSELLIRILSKKLDNFIENTVADPVWLNDKLLTLLNVPEKEIISEDPKQAEVIQNPVIPEPHIEVVIVESKETKTIEPDSEKNVTGDDKEESIKPDIVSTVSSQVSEPVEIKPAAVMRQRRGRQGKNEVKIYDRIIEGNVKTWDTDVDLQCISVGQDLLASLDEMTMSKLWEQEEAESSPNMRSSSPHPLWFDEEDTMDLESDQPKEFKKETSPKPTDLLLKDLQSTVHHAKTKIGDLQVPLNIDVPCKPPHDEAAGMMEGLFDKGIAGLKKGLRFTGLSDDSQEKSSLHKDKAHEKISPSDITQRKSRQETGTEVKEVPVPSKEENGNAVHLLVKQHRVISQDSVPSQAKARLEHATPPIPILPSDSPELEYEEAADLSSSIAKLRSLLQEAGPREEVWWESGSHQRGARPVDSAAPADEYDMNLNSSPGQTTNNMQRLDKLFQRTVTGVFNSIKTAVGGDEAAPARRLDWLYVCASPDLSVGGSVARLVGSRRAAAHVDAALDSLQQLPRAPPPPPPPEDLEEWCSVEGGRWSGACEVLAAVGLLTSHLTHRLATLLCADVAETWICAQLQHLAAWGRAQLFQLFRQLAGPAAPRAPGPRSFDAEKTCRALLQRLPEVYLFSEESLAAAVGLVVGSFSHADINRDVALRLLDLLAVHFKSSASLRNPSFDSN